MNIKKTILEKAKGNQSIKILRKYLNNDDKIVEYRSVQNESDFTSSFKMRYSEDHGISFSEYTNNDKHYKKEGKKEILENESVIVCNHINQHIIKLVMVRVFLDNHKKVFKEYFEKGLLNWCDYVYIKISHDNGITFKDTYQLKYENNKNFRSNIAYFGNNIEIDNHGNIYTATSVPADKCCKLLNMNVNDTTKNPAITNGIIVFKGAYQKDTDSYIFSHSKPIVIEDYKSSRGLMEPNIAFIDNNRLLLECRGSNAVSKGFNTRMKENTPSYRWIAISKDYGNTFTSPQPFTFDDGTTFFSPSSMSKIFRHSLTDKLYWIGNINNENPAGNRPRFPLYICEIDKNNNCLVKNTLQIIDDKNEDDGDLIQLSNFNIYENKITHNLHIEYSRLGESKEFKWYGDAISIIIDF